jgi:hypothetical protein
MHDALADAPHAPVTPVARRVPPRRAVSRRRRRGGLEISATTLFTGVVLISMWIGCLFLRADYRLVALPVATCITIPIVFLITLWRWNVQLPVFEVGAMFGAVSMLYAAVPGINYLSAGLTWTMLSDNRLPVEGIGTVEVARFTWPYAGFLLGFSITYLLVRGRKLPAMKPVAPLRLPQIVTIITLFLSVELFIHGIEFLYGINFDPSYLNGGLSEIDAYYRFPYLAQQIIHNVVGWRWVLKMLFVAICLHRWKESLVWRFALAGILLFEVAQSTLRMGSRTATALLTIAAVILFHRLVRPITFKVAVSAAVLLIVGFTLHGTARTVGGSLAYAQTKDARLWTTNNDFQTMFASGIIIEKYMREGYVGKAPWQAHFIDLVMLIPSQLLPIEKVDPSTWFYSSIKATQSSMFGLRAQPVIGFGWPDFMLRGVFLGALLAAIHRWYVKHSSSFWMLAFYCFVIVWSHYVYRSTMLWPAYFVMYEFVPVMLITRATSSLIQRFRGHSTTTAVSLS